MRRAALLILGAMVLLLSSTSCSYHGVAWRGRYWKYIEKNGLYVLKQDVLFSEQRHYHHDHWWDGVAWPGPDSSHTGGVLAKGTLIRLDRVYVDHSPLQYFSIYYTAVVESGDHAGKRAQIRHLFDGPSSAEYAGRPLPAILQKANTE